MGRQDPLGPAGTCHGQPGLARTCTVSATLLQQLNQIQQLQIQQLRKKTRFSNYRFSNYRFSNYPIQQLGQIQQLGFGNFATTDSATTQIQQLSSATKGPVLYYSYLWLAASQARLCSRSGSKSTVWRTELWEQCGGLVPPLQPSLATWRMKVGLGALFGAHNGGSTLANWSLHLCLRTECGTNSPQSSHNCVRQTVLPGPCPCARPPGQAQVEGPGARPPGLAAWLAGCLIACLAGLIVYPTLNECHRANPKGVPQTKP